MFNVDFTFLWTLFNLLLLFFILKKVLFGRVSAFMEKRVQGIADERNAAEKDRVEARSLRVACEEKLRKADEEGLEIIKQMRENAKLQAEAIIAEAKVQAEQILDSARRQMVSEQRAAVIAFKSHAAALILSASGRILEREVNSQDEERFAQALFQEISEKDV
ncbi:MAG: ATP synthase F0 subunit B [Spirochaetaceae bacterium]|jgi:F-type H+-transporting ATPase subunit b|nr:ATP synthase F0 subunit B [Spirochaetaceae bacterium]